MALKDLLHVRLVKISPDLRETNVLLRRIADALDRAIPLPDEIGSSESDPTPALGAMNEELLAAVEMLEDAGKEIPPEVYRRLNIAPPEQIQADLELDEALNAVQPGVRQAGQQLSLEEELLLKVARKKGL